jgi:hypothetical protein
MRCIDKAYDYVWLLFALVIVVVQPVLAMEQQTSSRFSVELEGGGVWQSKNDVQIPNTLEGTRFSLVDVVGKGPRPAGRLYLTWNITPRHGLRVLAAPLSIIETGNLPSKIRFEGVEFDPGVPTETTYRFNSWRLTYRYRFYQSIRWGGWIGFTTKIRDAKVQLTQVGASSKKTDVGFVPLLHVRGVYWFSDIWRLALDADALAGGPGRAVDASLKLYADINQRWSIAAGYRTVEGGADVEEAYNFAWLHYGVISVVLRF